MVKSSFQKVLDCDHFDCTENTMSAIWYHHWRRAYFVLFSSLSCLFCCPPRDSQSAFLVLMLQCKQSIWSNWNQMDLAISKCSYFLLHLQNSSWKIECSCSTGSSRPPGPQGHWSPASNLRSMSPEIFIEAHWDPKKKWNRLRPQNNSFWFCKRCDHS